MADGLMEKIVSLAKRRGFIYPGSELYGGLAGTYDYGPLGALLKNNIRDSWLAYFVRSKENMFLIDSPILLHPRVWEASGHTEEFIDPLVDDIVTKKRYRADHLLEEAGVDAEKLTVSEMDAKIKELKLLSPDGNALSDVRKFNMMLETKVGAAEDTAAKTYLRPEEAQNIFINFKNILDTFAPKLPFGVAQIGKAFRNEITPRDFTYRMREFEILEFEYFIHPDAAWEPVFDGFLQDQKNWLASLGIDSARLHALEHPPTGRAHYSQKTVDLEFEYPFGTKELTGLAHRGDYDLKRHEEYSGQPLSMLVEEGKEKVVPHVIEPTISADRALLAVLVSAYSEEGAGDDTRVYLKLPPKIAPYKACVSPLLKNKPELVSKAKEVYAAFKKEFGWVAWDDNGNIGKRYRRQDEIGTPFCVTIDFDTLGETPDLKDTVTVRDRDTGTQERLSIAEAIEKVRAAVS